MWHNLPLLLSTWNRLLIESNWIGCNAFARYWLDGNLIYFNFWFNNGQLPMTIQIGNEWNWASAMCVCVWPYIDCCWSFASICSRCSETDRLHYSLKMNQWWIVHFMTFARLVFGADKHDFPISNAYSVLLLLLLCVCVCVYVVI